MIEPSPAKWRRLACGALLVCAAAAGYPVGAKAQNRITHTNVNSWFMFGADIGLNPRWSVQLDAQERRSGPLSEAQARLVRPALAYAWRNNVRFAVGGGWSRTYPYGSLPIAYATSERRLFQQMQLSHAVGRFALAHRYRFEQRWQGRRGPDTTDHSIAHWARTSRFRYQLRATIPLVGQTIDNGEPYLVAFDELFVNFGRSVAFNVFDQNRVSAGVGFRFNPRWRSELAFMEQLQLKANGQDMERNHTFTLSLQYTRPAPQRR